MQRHLYPQDWHSISRRIRFERASGCCEQCGAVHGMAHPITGSKVVLTTAHLDHDTRNNDDANLAALCQRCHLRHDAELHAAHASVTRWAKKGGQLPLPYLKEKE